MERQIGSFFRLMFFSLGVQLFLIGGNLFFFFSVLYKNMLKCKISISNDIEKDNR